MAKFCFTARIVVSAVLVVLTASTTKVSASSETVLSSFPVQTYGYPIGALLRRTKTGALFGTTAGSPRGQIFKLEPLSGAWQLKTLVKFNGTNGQGGTGRLIQDSSGAFYGTTYEGGAQLCVVCTPVTSSGDGK